MIHSFSIFNNGRPGEPRSLDLIDLGTNEIFSETFRNGHQLFSLENFDNICY